MEQGHHLRRYSDGDGDDEALTPGATPEDSLDGDRSNARGLLEARGGCQRSREVPYDGVHLTGEVVCGGQAWPAYQIHEVFWSCSRGS